MTGHETRKQEPEHRVILPLLCTSVLVFSILKMYLVIV